MSRTTKTLTALSLAGAVAAAVSGLAAAQAADGKEKCYGGR